MGDPIWLNEVEGSVRDKPTARTQVTGNQPDKCGWIGNMLQHVETEHYIVSPCGNVSRIGQYDYVVGALVKDPSRKAF